MFLYLCRVHPYSLQNRLPGFCISDSAFFFIIASRHSSGFFPAATKPCAFIIAKFSLERAFAASSASSFVPSSQNLLVSFHPNFFAALRNSLQCPCIIAFTSFLLLY